MRKELENRRPAFAFNIIDANGTPYRLTTSFQNEDVKEVWSNGRYYLISKSPDKSKEIGRIISVALQNDVAFEELKSCATYHSDGRPATIIGELFDAIDFKG